LLIKPAVTTASSDHYNDETRIPIPDSEEDMSTQTGWRQLDIAIVGGGIGGQAAATSLRRQGHKVTIYEKADFVGEVGASISCAANGTRWLEEWNVNIELGDPVVLEKLISRDWKTGEPVSVYDLADYKERWGYVSHKPRLGMPIDLLNTNAVTGLQYVSPTIYA